jgi:hypothetical protein
VFPSKRGFVVLAMLAQALASSAWAQPVAVRNREGLVHGFLVLRTLDGNSLADGALLQTTPRAGQVESRLIFRFKDGSVQEESVVFTQDRVFRVLSYSIVQKGPSFPLQLDARLDVNDRRATVRSRKGDDESEEHSHTMDELPADLANGLVLTLLKNLPPQGGERVAHMVAFTPKPRLVKLVMAAEGEERFVLGNTSHRATRYRVKPELEGLAGLIAPLIGKDPQDVFVWVMGGSAPAFLKFEGPLFQGGAVCRMELVSPRWPGKGVPPADSPGRR